MEQDPYQIFTQAHRIYIRGVRTAITERLQTAYGTDWWERGALSAIGENQRANLERDQEKAAPTDDLAQLLDTPHFHRIAERHHAAAFADAFTDLDRTLALFRHLSKMRNQWAHVQDTQWTIPDAMQSVQAMQEILISLRRPEALELHKMFPDTLTQTPAIPNQALTAADDDDSPAPDDPDNDPPADERSLLGFWRALESYLVVESIVQPDSGSERDRGYANVLVRVTNSAPVSDGRPNIRFDNIELRAQSRNNQSKELGRLEPGQTRQAEFRLYKNELASVQFRVSCKIDQSRLFSLQRLNTLPDAVVTPLLEQLRVDFDNVEIEESLEKITSIAASIRPDMTLAEVSACRNELSQLKPIIAQKRQTLSRLFNTYHLDRESSIGEPYQEVIQLLQHLERDQLTAMDAAISNTDLESIRAAAHDFQQLQISALRARETIRRRIRPPQPQKSPPPMGEG